MSKFFSVTFEVLDETKFQALAAKFIEEMADGYTREGALAESTTAARRGYAVTACGQGDFATQADVYGNFIETETEMGLNTVLNDWLCENYPDHTAEEIKELLKGILG